MSLTRDEMTSYVNDTINRLNGLLESVRDAKTLGEFAEAFDELKGMAEDEAGYLEQVKSSLEDDVQGEIRDEFVTDLESDLANVSDGGPGDDESQDHHDGYVAGYQAAIDFLNEQY